MPAADAADDVDVDALSNAALGMRAAGLRLDVSANNAANVSTAGFRPSRADGGTVTPGDPAPVVPGVPDREQPSGTDLVTEVATLVTAPLAYTANARVLRAAYETGQSLLDVVG